MKVSEQEHAARTLEASPELAERAGLLALGALELVHPYESLRSQALSELTGLGSSRWSSADREVVLEADNRVVAVMKVAMDRACRVTHCSRVELSHVLSTLADALAGDPDEVDDEDESELESWDGQAL